MEVLMIIVDHNSNSRSRSSGSSGTSCYDSCSSDDDDDDLSFSLSFSLANDLLACFHTYSQTVSAYHISQDIIQNII